MSDLISKQVAIDALKGLPTWWADEGGYYGVAQPPMVALLDPEDAVSTIANLPSAQPEYEPVKAEDFAKTMSENTLYGFMAWHNEALALMERQGFVICKKTL